MLEHYKIIFYSLIFFIPTIILSQQSNQIDNLITVLFDPLTDYISTDPNDVGFYLYPNSDNWDDNDQLIYLNVSSIVNSRFNKSNPVIILTHGFIQNYTSEFPVYEKNAYLQAGYSTKANIITVDWGKLSGTIDFTNLTSDIASYPSYIKAVSNVYIVGKRLQEFIIFLIQNGYISDPGTIHLVGQSLGAHVSGMAGYYFKNLTQTNIGRITGTDPAGPSFQFAPINQRLDKTDANFVDIVHANQLEFGYDGTLGHVDFFVNGGGPIQPDCLLNVTDVVCAHNLAPRFYLKSILDPTIKACSVPLTLFLSICPGRQVIFGEHCPPSTRGSYYLNLNV